MKTELETGERPPQTLHVLVVDDEQNIRRTLKLCLESLGYAVTAVSNTQDAQSEAGRQVFDLAFVDLRIGEDNGLDLIPQLLGSSPWLKIVVITAFASVESAVEAMRCGATDYVAKPFTPEHIRIVADRVMTLRSLEQRVLAMKGDLERLHPSINFVSQCPEMRYAIEMARQVASSEAIVLLRGASGTGKTVLARAVHSWSNRAGRPFSTISCPTLSADLLESELFGHVKGAFTGAVTDNVGRIAACDGGTLLLDEIGDLPLPLQAKLLRFIQDREYEQLGDHRTRRADVRILAATNSDLRQGVQEGRFREDLYYRINVIQIDIPPLSARQADIERMAHEMLAFFGSQNHKSFLGFSDAAMTALKRYSWPGNVRELRNAIERAAILSKSETIDVTYLPESIVPGSPAPEIGDHVPLKQIEEAHIRRVIASTRTLQEAADILGIDQATLWHKRKLFGI